MRVNTKPPRKLPNLDDYDQGIDEAIDIVQMGALELSDHIEQKIENKPGGKGTLYKKWKHEVNKLIDAFNSKFGRRYNTIK